MATPASTPTPAPSSGTEPTAETKPADPAAPKPGESLAGAKPADGVPDAYTFAAPEGFELNPEVIAEATPIFKELGVNQEGAQKLFDLYTKHAAKSQTDLVDFFEQTRADWRKEIATDKTLGNGKDALSPAAAQNVSAAIAALPAEVQQPFRDAMNLTGAGDNPAFVRAMNALGEIIREGKTVTGNNPSPLGQQSPNRPRSAAQAMFPNLPSSAS